MSFKTIKNIIHDDLIDNEKRNNLLTEAAKSCITYNVKRQLITEHGIENLLNEHGDKAFLIPENTKLPIINPRTGKHDCGLIYAARIRTRQLSEYSHLREDADALYEQCGCTNRIDVEIDGHDSQYELINLIDLLVGEDNG